MGSRISDSSTAASSIAHCVKEFALNIENDCTKDEPREFVALSRCLKKFEKVLSNLNILEVQIVRIPSAFYPTDLPSNDGGFMKTIPGSSGWHVQKVNHNTIEARLCLGRSNLPLSNLESRISNFEFLSFSITKAQKKKLDRLMNPKIEDPNAVFEGLEFLRKTNSSADHLVLKMIVEIIKSYAIYFEKGKSILAQAQRSIQHYREALP